MQDDDVHRCFICLEPFEAGQMVLPDVNEGLAHRACYGEDRESFVKDVDIGEPLGPDDPVPTGYPYEPSDYDWQDGHPGPAAPVVPEKTKISPGHVCQHGIRWPWACDECDRATSVEGRP